MMRQSTTSCLALAALSALATSAALAQEAANVTAPTQPPPGSMILRGGARVWLFDGGAPEVERDGVVLEERFRLALGVTKELSAEVNLPVYQSFFDAPQPGQQPFDREAVGLGDLDVSVKLRLFKEDLGPVDTIRLSIVAGTEAPTSTEGFGSASWDPALGVTFMGIFGRHGFVQSLGWRFTTGSAEEPLFAGDTTADVFAFGSAYLYRLAPESFTEEHRGAWYLTAELLGTAETNGDVQVFLTPGLLYEGPRWVFECTIGLPIIQDLTHRPTNSFTAAIGFRVLF